MHQDVSARRKIMSAKQAEQVFFFLEKSIRMVTSSTVQQKKVERIARTSKWNHQGRFELTGTRGELLATDMYKAEAHWLKLREDAKQFDAAMAADRVQQARLEAEQQLECRRKSRQAREAVLVARGQEQDLSVQVRRQESSSRWRKESNRRDQSQTERSLANKKSRLSRVSATRLL